MAKEIVSLCPERNVYVAGDDRKISDKQQDSVNFERTPQLSADLRWICPRQENFATKLNIAGVGERISKRLWFAGLDENGNVASVRSISVASLRAMGLGLVKDGIEAPVVDAVVNEEGATRTAPGTRYIHAMDDTSWIKGENHLYVVKTPTAIRPTGNEEVYQAAFEDGKMQAIDGKVQLTTTNMKFFALDKAPADYEIEKATAAIKQAVGDNFYAL